MLNAIAARLQVLTTQPSSQYLHDPKQVPVRVSPWSNAKVDDPIRAWREHRGLSQLQLSQRAGISKAYLSQIECRKRAGSAATIRRLARALDVTVDALIGD